MLDLICDKHKSVCLSVCQCVHQSVRPLACLLAGLSTVNNHITDLIIDSAFVKDKINDLIIDTVSKNQTTNLWHSAVKYQITDLCFDKHRSGRGLLLWRKNINNITLEYCRSVVYYKDIMHAIMLRDEGGLGSTSYAAWLLPQGCGISLWGWGGGGKIKVVVM